MPTYLFAYRSPIGFQPNGDNLDAWMTWFASMGDQLVDAGQAVVAQSAVGEFDPATTQIGGYSLVNAPDLDAALIIAKGCPHLDRDGGVEVGELGEVPQPTT